MSPSSPRLLRYPLVESIVPLAADGDDFAHHAHVLHPRAIGNAIAVNICDYFRIDNGMLIEHWGVLDAAGMMHQLTAP
jgi:predicted SnoaL-like aldol condensation-catalyzing enzyme